MQIDRGKTYYFFTLTKAKNQYVYQIITFTKTLKSEEKTKNISQKKSSFYYTF